MQKISFFGHLEKCTGLEMHADAWLDGRNARAVMERQTAALASKLAEGGFDPLRKDAARISLVGICTGKVEELIQYRHVNILPTVANLNRRSVLKHLTCFVEKHPFTRYAVITNGRRCLVGHLRARLTSLARSVSRWASRARIEWNVEVVYRGTEVTVERSRRGPTYHPHANVLFSPAGRGMSCDRWSAFLQWSHEQIKGHWRDCGRLVDPKEAVKYPFKPAELAALEPNEAARLAEALHGLKLAQPLGTFLAFEKDLEVRGVKLAKLPDKVSGWKWCEVKRLKGKARIEQEAEHKKSAVNSLLSVLSPRPHFGPRMEPCALIQNYSGDLAAALCDVKDALEPAMARWRRLMSTPAPQLSGTDRQSVVVRSKPPPQAVFSSA